MAYSSAWPCPCGVSAPAWAARPDETLAFPWLRDPSSLPLPWQARWGLQPGAVGLNVGSLGAPQHRVGTQTMLGCETLAVPGPFPNQEWDRRSPLSTEIPSPQSPPFPVAHPACLTNSLLVPGVGLDRSSQRAESLATTPLVVGLLAGPGVHKGSGEPMVPPT